MLDASDMQMVPYGQNAQPPSVVPSPSSPASVANPMFSGQLQGDIVGDDDELPKASVGFGQTTCAVKSCNQVIVRQPSRQLYDVCRKQVNMW